MAIQSHEMIRPVANLQNISKAQDFALSHIDWGGIQRQIYNVNVTDSLTNTLGLVLDYYNIGLRCGISHLEVGLLSKTTADVDYTIDLGT
jgi:hypothetical protein